MGEVDNGGKAPRRKAKRVGRPPALNKRHIGVLRTLATQEPGASLEAITHQLAERCGVKVSTLTVRRALAAASIVRVRPDMPCVFRAAHSWKTARVGVTAWA